MWTFLGRAYRFIRHGNRRARINRLLDQRRKQRNEVLNEAELRRQSTRLKSNPPSLYLDPSTICNLKCPFCATGGGFSELKKELLQPGTFAQVVSNIRAELLTLVNLYNWGEPLMNPHLSQYIGFFHKKHAYTRLDTSFSAKDYDAGFFDKLIASGLDELTVSVDGATQETYEKYRINGDFNRVISNMRLLNETKKAVGSPTPVVIYKMLLSKHNEREVDDARRLAFDVGAEFVALEHFWVPTELRDEWIAESVKDKHGDASPGSYTRFDDGLIHTECRNLWTTLVVNANGDVFPCCIVFKPSQAVGNLAEQHIDEIWNNEKMVYLRKYVTDPDAAPPDFPNHCVTCPKRYCTCTDA